MKAINLIFPHQLFKESPLLDNGHKVYLIEEYLFFKQFTFHKQKIAFHRASMKNHESYLKQQGIEVNYIDAQNEIADIRCFAKEINSKGITEIHYIDPVDEWLSIRLKELEKHSNIHQYSNPQFLNTKEELSTFFKPEKKSFFQTTFYKQQRKKDNILIDSEGNPEGGKWTYDEENRKKYPKNKIPPAINFPKEDNCWKEALKYTDNFFKNNFGEVNTKLYPTNHREAQEWLEQFFHYRFFDFGIYEDAIVKENSILNHSILSPLLNTGLITPKEVINQTIKFAKNNKIPLNSVEGFIRQIIGWREFIRGMYISKGNYSRTKNFWKFKRKIPSSFYNGTTGIEPIDNTIKKVLKTGYCNHIERLMVLGNFMLLCEFNPDEVYRWFMELFIDAYDWVMVPNVYGMCLFADGGTFATKPYIGGSNYIKKMSNYPKGAWEATWDGLFWSFVINHQDFFKSNPRTSMLFFSLNRMNEDKIRIHQENANTFLSSIKD